MNVNPRKVRNDFRHIIDGMSPGSDIEVRLDDGTTWFIMTLKWCKTAIAPYCIFSPLSQERVFASDLMMDDDGVEFIDGNERRGFYWVNVETIIHKHPKYPKV